MVQLSPRQRNDESGAILVIAALVLVVLLGTSALVIDLGLAHVEQRKLQNGADAAALGAAQDLPGLAGSTASAVNDAQNLAGQNLPNHTLAWTPCTDTGHLVHVDPAAQCISFGPGFGTIRVRIPRQTFPTLFGGILGFDTVSTSKIAVAGVALAGAGSGLEPFTMLAGFNSGGFCLDSGGGGNSTQPCDGPTTGNFGLLDFTGCVANSGLGDNIAVGADHFYTVETNPGVGDIMDDCSQPGPNTASTDPGNKVGQEDPAMLGDGPFVDGGPGRLRRSPDNAGDFSPDWETTSNGLDNRPLWEFIPDTTLSGIPTECQRSTFTGLLGLTPPGQRQTTMYWAVDRCIFEYTCGLADTSSGPTDPKFTDPNLRYSCTGSRAGAPIAACGGTQCRAPVFAANTSSTDVLGLDVNDIVESPRFVYVPQVWQTTQCNGRCTYQLKAFRPVFIEGVGPNNGTRFEPGPWNQGSVSVNLANITSFVFPRPLANCTPTDADSCGSMLPGSLGVQQVSVGENAVIQLIK